MPQNTNPASRWTLAFKFTHEALGSQIIQQRFERVEIVVAEEGQDRGFPGATHHRKVVGQHREEPALPLESPVLGQQVACDQNEAWFLLRDHAHQLPPFSNVLVQVAGDDEPYRHRWV